MNFVNRIFTAVLFILLAGCASRPTGPVVRQVCLQQSVGNPEESAFLARREAEYLQEYGFVLSESGCEVTAKFTVFGSFQGEVIAGGIMGAFQAGRSGYWSIEGILAVTHAGVPVVEDQPIALRGYRSKQDLYAALAWEIVEPITKRFRSPTTK